MAQTCHNRAVLELTHSEGVAYWRAVRNKGAMAYQFGKPGEPAVIKATSDAVWKRFTPFASYRPMSRTRDIEAGPHLAFLKLKNMLLDNHRLYRKALNAFANQYGLLGLFYDQYSAPILPEKKSFIVPEAVIDEDGTLRRVDPSDEGIELLLDLLQRQRFLEGKQEREKVIRNELIALPSELRFAYKRPVGLWPPSPSGQELHSQRVSWEEAREGFGTLLVLDASSSTRVAVVCTCEPYFSWQAALEDFPSGPYFPADKVLATRLNREAMEISPYTYVGEDGQYEPGWRCPALLRAMYLMLYLDLTGDNTIRRCARRGCQNYFRVGSQERAIYCTKRCANHASTRKGRGQEP